MKLNLSIEDARDKIGSWESNTTRFFSLIAGKFNVDPVSRTASESRSF
ncbi:hypothetical protein ACWU4D_17955 [Vibrio sp. WJH972]